MQSFVSRFLFLPMLAIVALSGCGRGEGYALSESDEPSFRRGESLMRENRMDEALLAFESVVDSRRDCPESHLELGRIYMDHVKDPVSAIYHFRKFLELRPDAEMSKQVTQLIESAKKDFAKSLPGDPFGDNLNKVDVYDQIKKLRAENNELRRTVASLQEQIRGNPQRQTQNTATRPNADTRPATTTQTAARPAPTAASAKTYTVQTGDTLSKISQNVYGTTARWQEIFNANRNQLRNPHDLTVGMVLSIP